MTDTTTTDPRFGAAVVLIGRTGSTSIQLRISEPEPETGGPVVWMAMAEYHLDEHGKIDPKGATTTYKVAAGLDPLAATLHLCDDLIDGGTCMHCKRPSAFSEDHAPMPLSDTLCWYQWDPEMQTFRRSCEGSRTRD